MASNRTFLLEGSVTTCVGCADLQALRLRYATVGSVGLCALHATAAHDHDR